MSNTVNSVSLNKKLVDEFERLIAFIKQQQDKAYAEKDVKEANKQSFRLRTLRLALSVIKKYHEKITLKNYNDLSDISGIGKGTIKRVKEILENGKLAELGDFKDTKKDKKKALEDLESVIGIGRSKAIELYEEGIKSVNDLKKKHKKGKIELNDKILLGLKYYGVYQQNIPRDEITRIYKFIKKKVKQMNKHYKLSENYAYCFEICGSYRRERPYSNDIDILFTKFRTTPNSPENDKQLKRFVNRLKKESKFNNNQPLLVDDMTDKNIVTKYMGFCKYKDRPVRRIDIRYVPYTYYHSALLYFTGSADLNKKMRSIAIKKGYKLSEYGLFDKNDKRLPIKSERDIFKILGLEYLDPRLR